MAFEIFKLYGSLFVDNDKANKSINETDKKAEGFGNKLLSGVGKAAKWGAGVAAAAGAAAIAIGTKAVKAGADFEQQMSNVATLLDGDVNTRISELGTNVKDLARDTGVSTELLTDGLYQTISALGDSADSMGILETAAKGAKAGNAEVTDSVNLLSAVMKGYGDVSEEAATKASDLAFNTVKLGQTSFPELANSMGKVIPLASTMKVSQEELFGAMATLTGVTGGTAEVTTQLRGTIQGFMKPNAQMTESMKKLGYENGQVMIETLGLQGSLDALKGSVNDDEIAFANLFGSVEAKNAVLALAGAQAENFTEKTKSMTEAVGMTDAAFATQTDNFNSRVEKMKEGFNVMMISLGEKLLPLANTILEWVTDKMPFIEEILTTFFEVIGEVVTWLSNLFTTTTESIGISWDDVMNVLREVWETVGQPIFDLINGAIQFLEEHWDEISEMIKENFLFLWEVLQGTWETLGQPIFDFIMLAVELVAGYFEEKMPEIIDFFSGMVEDIKQFWENNLQPCFQAIGDFIKNVLAPAFEFVFNNIIAPVVDACFKGIKDLWNNSLKPILTGITDFLTGVFTGNWEKAFKGIVNIVKGIWNGLKTVIKTPINAVIGIINKFIGGLNNLKVPDWVPFVGGKGININPIPLLADGGNILTGGKAIVGEAGAELIDLPAGARVTPLNKGQSALGGEEVVSRMEQMCNLLEQMLERLNPNYQMVLDTGALVGEITPRSDRLMGETSKQRGRY